MSHDSMSQSNHLTVWKEVQKCTWPIATWVKDEVQQQGVLGYTIVFDQPAMQLASGHVTSTAASSAAVLQVFPQATQGRFLAQGCQRCHGAHIPNPVVRLPHRCIEHWNCGHQQYGHCGRIAKHELGTTHSRPRLSVPSKKAGTALIPAA